MRLVPLLITTIISIGFFAIVPANAQHISLKSEMKVIHESLGVNFVYDSDIIIDQPYWGKPMRDIINNSQKTNSAILDECLTTLFDNTGIKHEIMKKYIVLTHADKRNKPKDYTIFVEEQNDTIAEAVITALSTNSSNKTQTGLEEIYGKDFSRGFAILSSPDIFKTLQQLPGVASGTELLSGMYVRGGDGADNLYLLDGVPIYHASHLFGLFSSFNSDVVEAVDFYKSGFPAKYGGRISSVVAVKTRDGDFNDYHGSISIGLLEGRLQFDGPILKDKTSFNIGLRRSWIDVLTEPVCLLISSLRKSKFRAKYAFWDMNANITHKFSNKNSLSLNIYGGRDAAKLISGNDRHPDDTYRLMDLAKWGLEWGNFVTSIDWNNKFTSNHELTLKIYYSLYDSTFGLYNNHYLTNADYTEEANSSSKNKSRNYDVGLKADFNYRFVGCHHLRYGAAMKYHFYNPVSNSAKIERINDEITCDKNEMQYVVRHSFESDIYIEDEISVTKWFTANIGLRYSAIETEGKWYQSIEPRVALRFQCGDYTALKFSYSEMSQNSHLVSSTYIQLPTSFWMPSSSRIAPSRSRQIAGGVNILFPHNIKFHVEGYYKTMSNILEFRGKWGIYPPINLWEDEVVTGHGRSWGAENCLTWHNAKTSIEAYYTLSWSQRYFPDFYPVWYKDRNDNRHKLTLVATHRFGKRFELYASWNYHSGSWMTGESHGIWNGENRDEPETLHTCPNNLKIPDYHRLDIGFNFHKTTKRGNKSIWNISFYNAYCRMNPVGSQIEKSYDFSEGKTIGVTYYGVGYGIIPIIPSFSYTLNF